MTINAPKTILQSVTTLFTPLRIITAALLFWAVAKHSHNYYVFLRWDVFLIAAWGAYRSYQEVFDKWLMVFFHIAAMVLFNPFLPLTFEKSTWNVIDVIVGILMLMSIFITDSESTDHFFSKTIVGNLLGGGLTVAWLLGAFLIGLILIYLATDQALQDMRLWLGGSYGKAQITQVQHDVEELEDDRGRVGYRDYYKVDYTFTSNGRIFYGATSLDESPIDLGDEEDITPREPVFLDIEYQTRNPNNNRALASSSKLQHILPGLFFLALGLGAVFWSLKSCRTIFLNLKSVKAEKSL